MTILTYLDSSNLKRYLGWAALWAVALLSHHAYSQDCLATTDPSAFMSDHPQLLEEKLTQSTGRYSAVLASGDSVMAHFETCGLGIRAHYLSKTTLSSEQLKDTAAQFLSRVLPTNIVRDDILQQINEINSDQLLQGVVLSGKGDAHALSVEQYPHTGVNTIIHYRWIPPEY